MSEAWSRQEVEATVADYFSMLDMELRGEPFNKAEHNRSLQNLLNDRPRGAIERKHQNISAVLIEIGYPYIDGYKPLGNYQELLRLAVDERLARAADLNRIVEAVVENATVPRPVISDILAIQVTPPAREANAVRIREGPVVSRRLAGKRNYLEIEARNQSLGLAGEQLAVEFERERLRRLGTPKLADGIRHVAQLEGDWLGYDILSFEPDGRERLIEVKTTRFGASTPFFASRNEVNISQTHHEQYQLYRLFSFTTQPRLFALPGSLRNSCRLEPFTYSASVL